MESPPPDPLVWLLGRRAPEERAAADGVALSREGLLALRWLRLLGSGAGGGGAGRSQYTRFTRKTIQDSPARPSRIIEMGEITGPRLPWSPEGVVVGVGKAVAVAAAFAFVIFTTVRPTAGAVRITATASEMGSSEAAVYSRNKMSVAIVNCLDLPETYRLFREPLGGITGTAV